MRVAVPHTLGKEEATRRLKSRTGEIANYVPGGMAEVHVAWPSEDRLDLTVGAMGQQVAARLDIRDSEVIVEVQLPPALSFFGPMVQNAIERHGQKLLT